MTGAPDRGRWRGVTLDERAAFFKGVWFRTKARDRILETVRRRLVYIDIHAKSRGISVLCESGGGKSTLLEHLAKLYPREDQNGRTRAPFVLMKLPKLFSPSQLLTMALDAVGDPDPSEGKLKVRQDRLRDLLRKCDVKILAVDNFHDIPERARSTVRTVGNWFRDLVDDVPLLLLTLGTEDAKSVRVFNTQLRRRQMTEVEMEPFECKTEEGKKEWLKLLEQINDVLPLMEDSTIHLKPIRGQLFIASRGNFDYLIELVTQAFTRVVQDSRERIETRDFYDAFIDTHGTVADGSNPFSEDFKLHLLTGPGEIFEDLALGKSVTVRGGHVSV